LLLASPPSIAPADQPHIARLRAGAEQGALRAGEHFDALQVCRVYVEVAPGLGQRLVVEVERDIRREAGHASGRQVRGRRRDAADIDRILARPATAGCDGGQLHHIVREVRDAELLNIVAAERVHGNRHILERLLYPGRGDSDFLERSSPIGASLTGFLRRERTCDQGGRDGGRNSCSFRLRTEWHGDPLRISVFTYNGAKDSIHKRQILAIRDNFLLNVDFDTLDRRRFRRCCC
jgi:hypothetical protein